MLLANITKSDIFLLVLEKKKFSSLLISPTSSSFSFLRFSVQTASMQDDKPFSSSHNFLFSSFSFLIFRIDNRRNR